MFLFYKKVQNLGRVMQRTIGLLKRTLIPSRIPGKFHSKMTLRGIEDSWVFVGGGGSECIPRRERKLQRQILRSKKL